jgi:hypothetical protein
MSNNPRADHDWKIKILRRERTGDFAWTLSRMEWDIFSTLTFKNPIPHTKICYGMAWRWVRRLSEISGVPYNHLLIALRGEFGEAKGRFHFHCLVGGTSTRNSMTLSHQAESAWRIISGNSIPEVRPYNRSLAGAEYISKCLGANEYELGKYSLADSVTLSDSVFRALRTTVSNSERRHGYAQLKKQTGRETVGISSYSARGICRQKYFLR